MHTRFSFRKTCAKFFLSNQKRPKKLLVTGHPDKRFSTFSIWRKKGVTRRPRRKPGSLACLSTWRERAEHLLRHLCSCSARPRRHPSASAAGDRLPPIFKSPEPGSDSASAAATPPYGNVRAMIGASGARRAPAELRGRVAHGRVTGAGNKTLRWC